MSVSFTEKLLFAFVVLNLTIAMLIYRYTATDAPMMLIIQLMIPLIIWQVILSISFFPDEFITQFLDDFYGHDGAAGDQLLNESLPPSLIDSVHSHGDVPRTSDFAVAEEQMSLNFLF
uniref:Uncharacterized protein n=1 Tax=Elaeophora elaphi TaxID=1147741 RepID=A0A0R3RS15_9BILA